MENRVLEAIYTRYSCRSFTDQKVEMELLEEIVRAAMAAPSAKNVQPWEFIILDDREVMDQLCEALPYAKMLSSAQAAVVVCGVSSSVEGGSDHWVVDCSAATQNLLLAAHTLGLAAVWTAVYPYVERLEPTLKVLPMPEGVVPLCVVPIGYAAREPRVKDKFKSEKIHLNRW